MFARGRKPWKQGSITRKPKSSIVHYVETITMNTQGASLPCAQEAHLCLPLLWLVPPLTGQASYLQSEEESPDGPRSLSRSLPITHSP